MSEIRINKTIAGYEVFYAPTQDSRYSLNISFQSRIMALKSAVRYSRTEKVPLSESLIKECSLKRISTIEAYRPRGEER